MVLLDVHEREVDDDDFDYLEKDDVHDEDEYDEHVDDDDNNDDDYDEYFDYNSAKGTYDYNLNVTGNFSYIRLWFFLEIYLERLFLSER